MVTGIICIILIVAGIIWLIVKINDAKKENALQREIAMMHAKAKVSMALQQINRSYMLGLPELARQKGLPNGAIGSLEDRAIYQRITNADDPVAAFAKEIKPGKPTIAEFCLSMEKMLNRLMNEMQLSEEDMGNIYAEFLSMTTAVTDELIGAIAQSYASALPPEMYFLKDKINYELVCLGHIMQHGASNNRQDICQKVNSIRAKRGYID